MDNATSTPFGKGFSGVYLDCDEQADGFSLACWCAGREQLGRVMAFLGKTPDELEREDPDLMRGFRMSTQDHARIMGYHDVSPSEPQKLDEIFMKEFSLGVQDRRNHEVAISNRRRMRDQRRKNGKAEVVKLRSNPQQPVLQQPPKGEIVTSNQPRDQRLNGNSDSVAEPNNFRRTPSQPPKGEIVASNQPRRRRRRRRR